MVAANLLGLGMWMLQAEGETAGFDPLSMWHQMGWPARIVVVVLFIMSAWSIGVMIDRWIAFSSARKQSGFSPRQWRAR
jgi:biopolymer transport protein ExbB